ncbi:DUF7342 family protein [Halorubrum sp. DTA98]|uniref:DUF7342 family protein n=1 Tax=Halorubrum sp. DTA98 TaxID=3402163 RepID=UPI003AB06B91
MASDPRRDEDLDPETVFGALDDSACREIVRVLDEPMTAKEVSDRADMALSTAYKKLDRLESAAMLEERTEVDLDGHHRSQYVIAFDGVDVDLDEERRFVVDVEPTVIQPDDRLAEMWSQVRKET